MFVWPLVSCYRTTRSSQPAGGAGALTRLTRTAAATTTTTAALSTIANSLWPLFYYLPQSLTLALRCETRTAALIISAAADSHLTLSSVNNALSSRSAALLPLPVPLICGCSILLASASSSLFAAVYFKWGANLHSYLAQKYAQRRIFELNPVVLSKLVICGILLIFNPSFQFAQIWKIQVIICTCHQEQYSILFVGYNLLLM